MSINVRSYKANFEKFRVLFESTELVPDVLVICETWFVSDSTYEINGYMSQHVMRPGGRGGGISLYVRDDLDSIFIPELSYCDPTIEINSCKLTCESSEFIIIGVYRPHSGTIPNFSARNE